MSSNSELLRTVGNLCSILCSKAVTRATNAKVALGEKVLSPLKEAMSLASEHTLEIPAGLQAVATHLLRNDLNGRLGVQELVSTVDGVE